MFGRRKKTADSDGKAAKKPRRWYLRKRRILVWATVAGMVGLYLGYEYVTDPVRVQQVSQRELSELLGVPVKIGSAELNVFGDLLLRNVTITLGDGQRPEDHVLAMRRLDVNVSMSSLLRGDLRLQHVVASEVRINVCDNEDERMWNIQHLMPQAGGKAEGPSTTPSPLLGMQNLPALPDVQISDVSLVFSHVRGGQYVENPTIHLDAGLHLMGQGRCSFELLGRDGETAETPGRQLAMMSGAVDLKTGRVTARLQDVDLDKSMLRVLPRMVRRWCEDHQLRGAIRVPSLEYSPTGAGKYSFMVRVEFDKLGFVVQPRYWLSRQDRHRLEVVQASLQTFQMLGLNEWPTHDTADDAPLTPVRMVDYLSQSLQSKPVSLDGVAGAIVFTDQGIELERLQGEFEGNELVMSGRLDGYDPLSGYTPDGPARVHLASGPGKLLRIPPTPQFMTWMPDDVRHVYQQFVPVGACKLDVTVDRPVAGGDVDTTVAIDVVNSSFAYDDFPYPLEGCNGRIVFGRDPGTRQERVSVEHLRGHGVAGGPNEKSFLELNGIVGPFVKGGIGVDLRLVGKNVSSEPALRNAFPSEVKDVFTIFGTQDYAQRQEQTGLVAPPMTPTERLEWPRFVGDFEAHLFRAPGPKQRFMTDLSIDLLHAWGSLRMFPYPLEDISGKLHIYNDMLSLTDVHMKRNGATLRLDGDVKFGMPARPDITVKTTGVPIDEDLLRAVPMTERTWLIKSGLKGSVDIDGRVFLTDNARTRQHDIDFALDLSLHNGSLLPNDGKPMASELAGRMRLYPARLEIKHLAGRRGDATVAARGDLAWPDGDVSVKMHLDAKNLLLDKPLHDLLPKAAQAVWEQQKPQGTADIVLDYSGGATVGRPASRPSVPSDQATDAERAIAGPATAPTTSPSESIRLEIVPRELAATPAVFPIRLDKLGGKLLYDNGHLDLQDLTACYGQTTARVSGTGQTGLVSDFTLKIDADKVDLDDAFRRACPPAVATFLDGLKASGMANLHLSHLRVADSQRATPAAARPRPGAATGPSTQPAARPTDVEFEGSIELTGTNFEVGLPVTDAVGTVTMKGAIQADRVTAFVADARLSSYAVSGILGGDLTAHAEKPVGIDQIRVPDLRTNLAGGVLAGAFTYAWYDQAHPRYALDLLIRGASLKEILPGEQSFGDGRMAASLTAEGELAPKGYRRGRGDIRIEGKKMYKAPLVLGLVQMVDLGLPVTEPMNEVTVSYILDNSKIRIENMEMRSPTTVIQAKGTLDFATRKLDMVLTTDSPQKLKIPGLADFLAGVKKELFQIRVQGSLQEPRFQTRTLPAFGATIDQVFSESKHK